MTEHSHHNALAVESKLKFAIALSATILVVEVVGGFLSNSLALLSDAGHVFAASGGGLRGGAEVNQDMALNAAIVKAEQEAVAKADIVGQERDPGWLV